MLSSLHIRTGQGLFQGGFGGPFAPPPSSQPWQLGFHDGDIQVLS